MVAPGSGFSVLIDIVGQVVGGYATADDAGPTSTSQRPARPSAIIALTLIEAPFEPGPCGPLTLNNATT
jgi:hypothetical protein